MSTIKQLALAPMRRLFFHHLLAVSALLLAAQWGGGRAVHAPLVSPLAKDPATSLYTIFIKDGSGPLVVDLAGPLIWSACACASGHPTFPCGSAECAAASGFSWPPQGQEDYGGGAAVDGGDHRCMCTTRPCDPVTRARCAAGDLTSFAMSANATDGRNALYPVSFQAVGACAPNWLLRSSSLPAGAAGVAGFGRAPLSLPSQLAAQRGFGRRFALCLPGVAIFGDTPIHLGSYPPDLMTTIASTPLAANPKGSGGYYLPVEAISVSWSNWNVAPTRAALPPGALELDAATGRGGVTLSTVRRYTAMRPDVYRAFVQAFGEAIGRPGYVKTMPAVPPFELCYDTFSLRRVKVLGWDVPSIRLELGAGATMNWTVGAGNSMVQAAERTLCLAVVEMHGAEAAAPAVVIGGYQVEDNLLVFEEDKEVLHFSGLLWGSGATCSGFNFTAPL